MSSPNQTRGGQIATRGLLVQTIVALLDITTADPPFTEITLEPMIGDDQFDFLWTSADGSHAIQVKSTENSFAKSEVEEWARKLQQARTNEHCRLVLVGNIPPALAKLKPEGAVTIEAKNLKLDDLVEQAAHRVAVFLESEKLDAGTAEERLRLVHALESKLQHHATNAQPVSRAEFINLLRQWIGSVPKTGVTTSFSHFDVIKYAPAELLGREAELALLTDAWGNVQSQRTPRPHVLAFVALGGEGKTSLVAKWAAELAANDWPGCEAVFAWSFYSQGTREQNAASSDVFLNEALTFFGETEMAASAAGAFEKGQRLARVVGQKRALLILDGLEPLQYAPTSPTPGELKDQGLAALLKGLATGNRGLCVITTRYAVPDLNNFLGKTVHETRLQRLATAAGVALLKHLGVRGSERKTIPAENPRWNEYEQLVEDVQGHALTLNLLGTYLRDAHNGDIRRRDRIKLSEANAEEQGGHAFRVMDAYVQSLADGGKTDADAAKGRRALALLSLLGLFDRPATADCLAALWQAPAIAGLTEPLFTVEKKWLGLSQTFHPISETERNLALKRLEDARLLTVNRDEAGQLLSLDAHPLVREYFGARVKAQQQEAWRAAHRRLYEHLCATTADKDQPTLADLQPLYQAVAHGCQAG
ncbi:MAG: ATP-binding protein, partial [Acidobacteria bacterium]|nr:ATP-binding protein [Acidobacteriota bacterium]